MSIMSDGSEVSTKEVDVLMVVEQKNSSTIITTDISMNNDLNNNQNDHEDDGVVLLRSQCNETGCCKVDQNSLKHHHHHKRKKSVDDDDNNNNNDEVVNLISKKKSSIVGVKRLKRTKKLIATTAATTTTIIKKNGTKNLKNESVASSLNKPKTISTINKTKKNFFASSTSSSVSVIEKSKNSNQTETKTITSFVVDDNQSDTKKQSSTLITQENITTNTSSSSSSNNLTTNKNKHHQNNKAFETAAVQSTISKDSIFQKNNFDKKIGIEFSNHQNVLKDIDNSIRLRYRQYFNLDQSLRDQQKTDYTYAHSYSYSDLVPKKERFNWTVPNMSRSSIRHATTNGGQKFLDESRFTRKFVDRIPITEINPNNIAYNAKFIKHSTPLKTSTTSNMKMKSSRQTNRRSTTEYSDDDEIEEHHQIIQENDTSDDEDEDGNLNQTVRIYPKNDAKFRNQKNFDNHQQQLRTYQYSEDDDRSEEELTLIKRINRFFVTKIRRVFLPNSDQNSDETITIRTNGNLPSTYYSRNQQYHNYQNNRIISSSFSSSSQNSKFWWWSFLIVLLLSCLLGYFFLGDKSYRLQNLIDQTLTNGDDENGRQVVSTKWFSSLWTWNTGDFIWPLGLARLFSSSNEQSQSKNSLVHSDLLHLSAELRSLRDDLNLLKRNNKQSASPPEKSLPDPDIDKLLNRIETLEMKIINCCQANQNGTIEKKVLEDLYDDFKKQYDSKLESSIENVKQYLLLQMKQQQQKTIDSSNDDSTSANNQNSLDLSEIELMIKSALAKYDADKTGEADFALESSGAWVVSTRCSETYKLSSASYQLLGITLWRSTNSPRVVFQSGVVPGECWCLRGSQGRIAVRLSARIIPTAFTYEHIPASLSRDGNVHSAPAKLVAHGLKSQDDAEPDFLGEYWYSLEKEPLQRFEVQRQETAKHTFRYIELEVKSNHGHPEYTCLYRFRVHGIPVPDNIGDDL